MFSAGHEIGVMAGLYFMVKLLVISNDNRQSSFVFNALVVVAFVVILALTVGEAGMVIVGMHR